MLAVKSVLRGVAVAIAALALLPAAALADGQLDPSFGSGGRVIIGHAAGEGVEGTSSLFQLGGGRFLAGGIGGGSGVWMTQYLADGSLDGSFGAGGQAFVNLSKFTSPTDEIREPDGAIVAVGGWQPESEFDTFVMRLTPQGGLDPSFGNDAPNPAGDGIDSYDFGGEDLAEDLVLDSTGKAVVVGRAGPSGEYDVHLARLNADGSIDASFGGPEGVYTELDGSEDGLKIALQGDRLVVLATGAGGTYVLRYLPDGELDPSFGGGGGALATPLAADLDAGGLLIEPDGDILVAGGNGEQTQIVRLLPNGAPDPGWGNDGVVSFSAQPGKALYVGALARMDDGRILDGGGIATKGGKGEERPILIRTLPNGQPDPAWGSGGMLQLPPGPGLEEGIGVLQVEPNRRILAGGSTNSEAEGVNRELWRILGDTTPPDTAITQAPPAAGKAPLARAQFAFAAVGDTNTSFECALTQTPLPRPKKHRKKRHHKKHHHRKKPGARAKGSLATTLAAAPAFAPCASPVAYPGFAKPGSYRFAVRAIDPAGNVDPTPAEANVHLTAKPLPKKHRKHHRRKHHKRHRHR